MKKMKFAAIAVLATIVLQACSNAGASSVKPESAKTEKPKSPMYKVIANGETYEDIRTLTTDSSGCISFHLAKQSGCGCGSGTPEKDVKICGSYLIEKTME
jgi:hypothetical protein